MPAAKDLNFAAGYEAFSLLSDKARAFVKTHPNKARMAISVALESAAVLDEDVTNIDIPADVPVGLKRFFVKDPLNTQKDILTAMNAAKELGITRQSVYSWISQGKLLAWETSKRGKHIPGEQILGINEVVSGIRDVLDIIPEQRSAWKFLTEKSPFFDTPKRPIDVLKTGNVAAVCAAANSYGESFS